MPPLTGNHNYNDHFVNPFECMHGRITDMTVSSLSASPIDLRSTCFVCLSATDHVINQLKADAYLLWGDGLGQNNSCESIF